MGIEARGHGAHMPHLMSCTWIGFQQTANRPLFDKGFKRELTPNLIGIGGQNLKKISKIYIIVIDNVLSITVSYKIGENMTTTALRAVKSMSLQLKKIQKHVFLETIEVVMTMIFTLLLPVFIIALSM